MPAATRFGDVCASHCFNARSNNTASEDVIINNLGAHRVDDGWPAHSCGPSSHGSKTKDGSSTVIINNKKAVRIGDPLDCGDTVAQGSENVIFGG